MRARLNSLLKAESWPLKAGQKGFTLLLAALIASIVLSIGAAIFSIAQKELALSSIGRDSQFAFYAADSAAECALYWDVRFSAFATSTTPHTLIPMSCEQSSLSVSEDLAALAATSTFNLDIASVDAHNNPITYCATVSVAKYVNNVTQTISSVIHADGFSANCASYQTSPHALQRSVELHY